MSTPTTDEDMPRLGPIGSTTDEGRQTTDDNLSSSIVHRPSSYPFDPLHIRAWQWAIVPILAITAYITVLRVGFLSDDFAQVYSGRASGVNLSAFLPTELAGFYRPVGVALIWQLGYFLWGYNPFPYHLLQLLMHAAISLLLGLWLARLTGRPGMGWLAGALFAVFPLHLEAVGFIGAQFDSYSALFVLGSLWSFDAWWRGWKVGALGRWKVGRLYAASLLLYCLAAFTKEIVFLFIAVFAASAWFVAPPSNWREWRKLGYALLPFCLPVILNIAVRFSKWGTLGGYGNETNYGEIVWDNLATYMRLLLAPLNPAVVDVIWVQAAGLFGMIAVLVGLVLFGREQRRLLLLAGIWVAVVVVPVLGLPPMRENLEGNRYLYLMSAGYMVGVSALLYSAIIHAGRWRKLLVGAVSLAIVLATTACWVQLRPWHTATVQVNDIVSGLLRMIPPQPRPNGMEWYVENIPARYKGVPALLSGLGVSRLFVTGDVDYPHIQRVSDAEHIPISNDLADAFALRFAYNESRNRFDIAYLSGITFGSPPPSPLEAGDGILVWDFRECSTQATQSWQVTGAKSVCQQSNGLAVQTGGDDVQLIGPEVSINPWDSGARFIRLRIAVSYPLSSGGGQLLNEWFWHGPNDDWGPEFSRATPIKRDGKSNVYWTFLPIDSVAQGVSGLRFDPANGKVPSTIQWIAVDLVK